MKSFLVNKFTCPSCSSSYIGETCCHINTRIEDYTKKDNKSDLFKGIHSTAKPQYALTHIIPFVLKQMKKLTLNSTWKLKKFYILFGENLT